MAKVDDATTADGASAGWFKISEGGLPSNNPEYWETEVLNVCISMECFGIPFFIILYRTTAAITPSQYQTLRRVSTSFAQRLSVSRFHILCSYVDLSDFLALHVASSVGGAQ